MLIISNMIYLVLCSLSGLFFYCFLIHKATDTETSYNHIIMITLSSVYSLSSYMIHVGMNLSLLPGLVLFPLIMIGFRKLHSDTKPLLYILTMSIAAVLSFQTAACIFIFCLLYIVIPNYRNIHHFLVTLTLKLLSDIIIIGTNGSANRIFHVGIYYNNGLYIHANGELVTISKVPASMVVSIIRLPGLDI